MARRKSRELLNALLKKKPDASSFRFDADTFTDSTLDEFVGSQGLFENKYIVVFDRVFLNKEAKEEIVKNIEAIANSSNIFILLEGELDKKTLGILSKKADKVQEFPLKGKTEKKESFNMFALADAFGKRDKKELWMLYLEALRNDAAPEELHGILFWQLKSMIISHVSSDAKTAGLNPFVFKKSKSFAKNYSLQELKELSSRMVAMYHDAHRGLVEFEVALERFVLGL